MGKQGQRKHPTKKQFQELLNRWDEAEKAKPGYRPFRNNQFHQRTRLYGDYLRAQDPTMFNVFYQEYLDGHWDDKFAPFECQ